MTYGYAKAIWSRLSGHLTAVGPEFTLFQLDELHFEQPQQIWLNARLKQAGFWRVVSTATPSFSILKEVFTTFHAPLKSKYDTHRLGLRENVNKVYIADAVLRDENATKLGFNQRLLIVEPSERECDKIADSLRLHAHEYNPGFAVNVVSRSRPSVPSTGHIVITQMGRTGVTIPGITCVLGSHEIVSHFGTVQHRPLSLSAMIQEKGRTGRTNHGVYIQCTTALSQTRAVEVSDPYDMLQYIDLYNTEGRYGLLTDLIKIPPDISGTRFNEWLAHDLALNHWQYKSIKLYIEIRHSYYAEDLVEIFSENGYEGMRAGNCPQELEHLAEDLEGILPFYDFKALLHGIYGLTRHGKRYGWLTFNHNMIVIGTLSEAKLRDAGKPKYSDQAIVDGQLAVEDFFKSLSPLTDQELEGSDESSQELTGPQGDPVGPMSEVNCSLLPSVNRSISHFDEETEAFLRDMHNLETSQRILVLEYTSMTG